MADIVRRRRLATLVSLGLPLLVSAPALAQQASDEIVVTATRREEALKDVPIAINVLSQAQITDSGAANLSNIIDQLPGVELRNERPGAGAIAIRGISELNTSNIFGATGTAVGLYIDETPFSVGGYFPQSALFDVKRIEVLRGPQGTIFGEGSLAGTVRIITNHPDAQAVDASLETSYGSIRDGDTNTSINGMLNLPIVADKLAVRLTAFSQSNGGWIDRVDPVVTASFRPPPNPVLGATVPDVQSTFTAGRVQKDANDSESTGGRLQIKWTPTTSFSAVASAMHQESDSGYSNRGRKSRIGTFSTDLEGMNDTTDVYSLVLEQRASFGSFLSSTNKFQRDIQETRDQIGIVPLANQIGFPLSGGAFTFQGSRVDQDLNVEEVNQELRFVSDFKGPFQLTAGVFYRERDIDFRIRGPQEPLTPGALANALAGGALAPIFAPNPVPAGFGDLDSRSVSTTTQKAVFAEGTYDFSDRWSLLVGARYFQDDRDSVTVATSLFSGLPFPTTFRSSASENVFNPRASLRFKANDDLTLYASIGRGFRSGGQNDLYPLVAGATASDLLYDPETLTTYEIGLKSIQRGKGAFNAAVFYNDWSDLQVVTAEGTGGVGEIIGNAGAARSIGLDIDGSYALTERLTLAGGATFLDTQVENIIASRTLIRKADIPGVANTTLSLNATYRRPITDSLGVFARVGAAHRSDVLSGLLRIGTPAENLPSYTTLDLRSGVEGKRWALTLFVDNATDEFIPLGQFVSTSASVPSGGDPVTGEALYFQGSPRVIGVSLRWKLNP